MTAFLFYVIAGVTGLCAIATVATQNIVRAATWLLFTLSGTSVIFFLLGADLVGAVQLMVYVGGTLVLVVFGVMLTAQGPFINIKTSSAEWAIAATVGLVLLVILAIGIGTLGNGMLQRPPMTTGHNELIFKALQEENLNNDPATAPYSAVIGAAFLGAPVGPPHIERASALDKGDKVKVVRASYLLPFEIVSIHLLVVLIGAAYLARAKRRKTPQAKDALPSPSPGASA